MIATVLLIAGVGLMLIAVGGVLAMDDVYDRLHYTGVAGFAALVIAVAVAARNPFSLIGNKALLTGLLVFAASPVIAHATARAARLRDPPEGKP